MSATNRGAERRPDDAYYTPAWCVHALLNAVQLPGGLWLEPACGDGAIIRAVNEVRDDVVWRALDIRPEAVESVRPLPGVGGAAWCDFADESIPMPLRGPADVLITNPPFFLALPFVQRAVAVAPIVAMLLRLPWLASQKRSAWLREHMPDVYILPRRPSFTGGGTDATDYAWMIWTSLPQRTGRVQILDL